MDGKILEFQVVEQQSGNRIDKFIAAQQEDFTRSYLQRLIKENYVKVNEKIAKANYKVATGDNITIFIPTPTPLNIQAENIPLDILYEDQDIILINKGKGMVVHPAPGHYSGTIVNGLLYHCKNQLSGINGIMRPGIVHRIDRNTTGVIVVCKNDKSHNFISEQLKEHSITRRYFAIAYHYFKEKEGVIDAPIGRHPIDRKKMSVNYKNGKSAITHYSVIEELKDNFSYIQCQLKTGRTHQIRVHMASIHHPLLGDDVYGPKKSNYKLEGQVLHAKTLGLIHPTTHKYMEFEAPLPEYFSKLLEKLQK